ncbi:hypothetical protein BDZ89DRAFT_1155565 [Hymenopellis radicata]|nr:hypothetical protein BDZ89DRAFT_1155565 [Hymenopellis radicata]
MSQIQLSMPPPPPPPMPPPQHGAVEYELKVRQQPKQARMCGVGGKADRRPIDPPPIVQLVIRPLNSASSTSNSGSSNLGFLQNPYYFMFASLAKPDDDTELHWLKDGRTRCTQGSVVSSLYHLKDNDEDVGFFVFPDVSVRTEGSYRLKLSLFEVTGNMVKHCKSVFSTPFYVYTAKKFPGMEQSTQLSVSLADQGIKIRIRKDIRVKGPDRKRQRREDEEEVNNEKGQIGALVPTPAAIIPASTTQAMPPPPPPQTIPPPPGATHVQNQSYSPPPLPTQSRSSPPPMAPQAQQPPHQPQTHPHSAPAPEYYHHGPYDYYYPHPPPMWHYPPPPPPGYPPGPEAYHHASNGPVPSQRMPPPPMPYYYPAWGTPPGWARLPLLDLDLGLEIMHRGPENYVPRPEYGQGSGQPQNTIPPPPGAQRMGGEDYTTSREYTQTPREYSQPPPAPPPQPREYTPHPPHHVQREYTPHPREYPPPREYSPPPEPESTSPPSHHIGPRLIMDGAVGTILREAIRVQQVQFPIRKYEWWILVRLEYRRLCDSFAAFRECYVGRHLFEFDSSSG